MKHLFIPYELALLAKEKGFDEPCLGLYHQDGMFVVQQTLSHNQYYGQICSAPLYQQITEWFEKEHKLFIGLERMANPTEPKIFFVKKFTEKGYREGSEVTFDKAIEAAFKLI